MNNYLTNSKVPKYDDIVFKQKTVTRIIRIND
ncbi:MAG: hypothetical protein ACI97N_000329 [Cognaticolwellia sp.]|jgi:hypothetical protein